ncbi:MAG TPA: PP2C family protein-serine/threonine phosphatase [Actinomycetota bacterium]
MLVEATGRLRRAALRDAVVQLWLPPYLLIAAVAVSDLLLRNGLSTGAFLVLAPLLASRLEAGRAGILASGLVALAVALLLGEFHHPGQDTQLGIRLLLIAAAIPIALVNQGAHRRERSTLGRAADTITIAASLAAGLETGQAYRLLARSARSLYAASAVAVYRRQGSLLLAVAQDRADLAPPLPDQLSADEFPDAFSEEPLQAFGPPALPAVPPRQRASEIRMLQARGFAGLLWLPLVHPEGRQIGTILLAWRHRRPRLSAHDLEVSRRFAGLGARAISGSERVKAQADLLRQLQALLLTTPPAWAGGYRIGVRYQSASGLAQIGGDFYDVAEVDGKGLAFILADARGKGVEASSMAAVLKGAFRTLAGEGAGPARTLARLDRLVAREGGDEDFVTALAGRLYQNGRVVLASAGHPAPLGAGPPLVPRAAAPLGLGSDPLDAYGLLRPGQRLICYTDGLVEARDHAGRFIDRARLDAAVSAEQSDLQAVLDSLVALVADHADGRYADDLALLGLEYCPGG